jgi:hypothetical protein
MVSLAFCPLVNTICKESSVCLISNELDQIMTLYYFTDFNHALVLEPMNKTAGVAINRLKKLFP